MLFRSLHWRERHYSRLCPGDAAPREAVLQSVIVSCPTAICCKHDSSWLRFVILPFQNPALTRRRRQWRNNEIHRLNPQNANSSPWPGEVRAAGKSSLRRRSQDKSRSRPSHSSSVAVSVASPFSGTTCELRSSPLSRGLDSEPPRGSFSDG